jgi:hypothetical protein
MLTERIPGAARRLTAGGGVLLRPGREALDLAGRAVVQIGGMATLTLVDAVLASPYADRAMQRIVESELAEAAVAQALSGDLVDVFAEDLVRYDVVARVVDQLPVRAAIDRTLDRLDEEAVPQLIADRVLASRVVEDAVSRMVEDVVHRLRASEALWSLIDDIASSPAVADAITQQGAGFADQVGEEIRERSRHADERMERAAWRLLRRRAPGGAAPPATGAA